MSANKMHMRVFLILLIFLVANQVFASDQDARENGVADYLMKKHQIELIRASKVSEREIVVHMVHIGGRSQVQQKVSLNSPVFNRFILGEDAKYDWRDLNTKYGEIRPWVKSELIIQYLESLDKINSAQQSLRRDIEDGKPIEWPSKNVSETAGKTLVVFAEAVLQAELDGACTMNIDKRYQYSVANIGDCKAEIESQIETISSTPELSSYLSKLQHFKSTYDL